VGSTSPSTAQMYVRGAESEERKAAAAASKLAAVIEKLARNSSDQNSKRRSLGAAEKSEREAVERDEKRRLDTARRSQAASDRATDQRRRQEMDHAKALSRMASPTMRHVYVREPEPERLRVLYLTASPDVGNPLRTDAEVNNVLKALRGAKHRDQVELHLRPAATSQDLMDGINDVRPHVIHFSGHGDGQGLLFDNASLDAPEGRQIPFELLTRLLDATDTPPALLVLNACETLAGSDSLLEVTPVVVAMADSVGDMAAGVFATHFYAGIASAQSVGAALRQAQVSMELALLEDAVAPQCVARAGIDVDQFILVKPH
jgi:hypothetical protein